MKKLFDIDTDENFYHITWVTHNSRISERMIEYNVKPGEAVILTSNDIDEIQKYIEIIKKEKNIKVLEYKVNKDHVHIVIKCKEIDRNKIVKTLKSKITYLYKKRHEINDNYHLWGQKYNSSIIKTEEELENVLRYVKYNDLKHSEE